MTEKTFQGLADVCFSSNSKRILLYDTSDNRSYKYSEAFNLTIRTSQYLSARGVSKGDFILSYCPLSVESVILCWASLYIGAVFVPVDYNWPKEILTHIIEETRPELILTDPERISHFNDYISNCIILLSGKNKVDNYPPLFEVIENSTSRPYPEKPKASPADMAVILYTSGSTGIPKGVVLSHKALFNSGSLIAAFFGWKSDDLFMNLGDLHAMSGLRNTCFAPLHAGASFVIASAAERNSILLVLELISRLKVTFIGVAPTIIRQLNIIHNKSRKDRLLSLKAILCTGGNLAHDQLLAFYSKYNIPVLNYYGLTETAGICSGHNLDTFNPDDNSIGPAAGAQLIIEPDPYCGNEINTGELIVKSDNLMSGYYKKEAETSRVLKNGLFYTGDIVRRRKDGCFEILGRKRNIIKNRQSELIYLEEIDSALESYPLIEEACACSYSQSEEDEKIVALIVLKKSNSLSIDDTIADLKTHLLEKLGKNRMPWCYYLEESLPRNTAGKYQRQLIKNKLTENIQSHSKRYC